MNQWERKIGGGGLHVRGLKAWKHLNAQRFADTTRWYIASTWFASFNDKFDTLKIGNHGAHSLFWKQRIYDKHKRDVLDVLEMCDRIANGLRNVIPTLNKPKDPP